MPVLTHSGTRHVGDIDPIHAGTVPRTHKMSHKTPFLKVMQGRSTRIDNHLDTKGTHLLHYETERIISDITIVQQVRDASSNVRCKTCHFLEVGVLALFACGT